MGTRTSACAWTAGQQPLSLPPYSSPLATECQPTSGSKLGVTRETVGKERRKGGKEEAAGGSYQTEQIKISSPPLN